MMRTKLFTCLIIACGAIDDADGQQLYSPQTLNAPAFYATPVSSPRSPAVEKAANELQQQEAALADRQRKLREESPDGQKTDDEQARGELRLLVKQSFDARQKLRTSQVKELQQRLRDVERAIGKSQANEDAIIDARVDDLLSGKAVAWQRHLPGGPPPVLREERFVKDGKEIVVVTTAPPGLAQSPRLIPQGSTTYQPSDSVAGNPAVTKLPEISIPEMRAPEVVSGMMATSGSQPAQPVDTGDIVTREQMARIELEVETAKRDAAKADHDSHKLANDRAPGSTPRLQMQRLATILRVAEAELKRAEAKLEAIKREHANLAAIAEIGVEEAEAARHKADAKRQGSVALVETAEAEIVKAEASERSALSSLGHRQKKYDRVKLLKTQNAVDDALLHETAEELNVASGALESARAAVKIAKSNAGQAKSAAEESLADLELAEARLRAAKARRDRLAGPRGANEAAEKTPRPNPR